MRLTLILCCLAIGLSSPSAISLSVGHGVEPPESDSEILDLLKDTPKPDYGATVATEISERVVVHAAGRVSGAEGVSVTDGYSVTKTDAQASNANSQGWAGSIIHDCRWSQVTRRLCNSSSRDRRNEDQAAGTCQAKGTANELAESSSDHKGRN